MIKVKRKIAFQGEAHKRRDVAKATGSKAGKGADLRAVTTATDDEDGLAGAEEDVGED